MSLTLLEQYIRLAITESSTVDDVLWVAEKTEAHAQELFYNKQLCSAYHLFKHAKLEYEKFLRITDDPGLIATAEIHIERINGMIGRCKPSCSTIKISDEYDKHRHSAEDEMYVNNVLETHMARVPNQLMSPDVGDTNDDEADESVNEFSGVGAIAGYSAPLGMDPDLLGRKKNKSKKKK